MDYRIILSNEESISLLYDYFKKCDFDHKEYKIFVTQDHNNGSINTYVFNSSHFRGYDEATKLCYFFEMFCEYGEYKWRETPEHYFKHHLRCLYLYMVTHGVTFDVTIREVENVN